MIKNSYWHGVVVGIASGIAFGFMFSIWIALWIGGPHADYGPYYLAFMASGFLAVFIAFLFHHLPGDSRQEPSN
jgi:hypothetical protein